MLTETLKVIPFYFSCVYAFFLLRNFKGVTFKSHPLLHFCTTQQIANVSGGEWAQLGLHHHRHNLFCFLLKRKEERIKGRQKQGRQKSAWDEREKRKLPRLQQHSFSVRHLLFYCNLMALLSPGASRQSPLYHMAIISVALLCDSLTLSTVTCDPL